MNLSNEQNIILEAGNPRLFLSGCAGSGKTELNLAWVEKFLSEGYDPDDILACSFATNDAEKFGERLEEVVPQDVLVSTVHSRCYRSYWDEQREEEASKFLNEVGTLKLTTGRKRLELIDSAVAKIKPHYELDYARDIEYLKAVGVRETDPRAGSLRTPQVDYLASKLKLDCDGVGEVLSCRVAVYRQYQKQLDILGCVDFGELLFKGGDAMKRLPKYPKIVIMDEVQDFNKAMLDATTPLLQNAEHVILSGDEMQSIYSFRGAVGINIEARIRKILPSVTTENLIENHRSAPEIVQYAETIIERGMVATRDIKGEVVLHEDVFHDKREHANVVLSTVQMLKERGLEYKDIAIACRLRAPMPGLQMALTKAGIPNQVGVTPFTQLPEIRDLTAWLEMSDKQLLQSRANKQHPIWRVARAPREKNSPLGNTWLRIARKMGTANQVLDESKYPETYREAVTVLRNNIADVQTLVTPVDILRYVVNSMEPRYYDYQVSMSAEKLGDPMSDVDSFIGLASDFDEVGKLLNFMSKLDTVLRRDVVEITTIHGSKGREWEAVIQVNCVGDFLYYANRNEERRLDYVAGTRAEKFFFKTTVTI